MRLFIAIIVSATGLIWGSSSRAADPAEVDFFERRVRPVLVARPRGPIHFGKTRCCGVETIAAGRRGNFAPATIIRSHRFAADAKRTCDLHHHGKRSESLARFAALRRTVGPSLARPGAV